MNLFSKIAQGFRKTREALSDGIRSVVGNRTLDEEALEELEEILITADLGVDVSLELIERLRKRHEGQPLAGDAVLAALGEELETMLTGIAGEEPSGEAAAPPPKPRVTFIVGVNGSGKTTTLGKLARRAADEGRSVLVVAADTFRGAAVEQLEIWAGRAGVDIVRGTTGGDPGAVVYDGLQAALARGVDEVFVDTAGRLHTRVNLMRELEKLDRVAKKVIPGAPHEVLLVLDGTTGQNGLSQARAFTQACGVTGIVVTKLDGTAKGGVIVPVGRELGIPVRWIGLGEGVEDLVPFDPGMVVRAVIGDAPGGETAP